MMSEYHTDDAQIPRKMTKSIHLQQPAAVIETAQNGKINLKYLASRLFKKIEQLRSLDFRLQLSKSCYPKSLWPWCGVDNIYLAQQREHERVKLTEYYTQLKGKLHRVKIHHERKISYDDHVSRIHTKNGLLDTATFTRPQLSATEFHTLDLKNIVCEPKVQMISKAYPYLQNIPEPFDYKEMEKEKSLYRPAVVGIPEKLGKHYILNQANELTENLLHMPVKITKDKAQSLEGEGRVLSDLNSNIRHDEIYLPKELHSLLPLIEYACGIEKTYNPYFLENYYLFITVSHSIISQNQSQRRGGWHIDGHQGYERVQKDGQKLWCDRQYLICNTLPTQSIAHQFNFDKLRKYCKTHFCQLDSINMQDVIEIHASHQEQKDNSCVSEIPVNQLVFLNPYMVHRASRNPCDAVKRTFVRILFSTYARDRLGDSINPVFGPLYPMKVKTITDIHEVPPQYII